jgi:hypothetical protein
MKTNDNCLELILDKKNMDFNKILSQIYANSYNYLQYTSTLPGTKNSNTWVCVKLNTKSLHYSQ